MANVSPGTVLVGGYHKAVLLLAFAATAVMAILLTPAVPCSAGDTNCVTDTPYLRYGVLGDSWASGITYLANNQYDDNSSGCMRTTQAYAVRMKNDLNWANGTQYLEFPACSGSRLYNIAAADNNQMSQLIDPNITIMTIGGNNAGFDTIASSCIYQPDNCTYGPEYADDTQRVGVCAKAIDNWKAYITGTGLGSFYSDLISTYQDILDSPQAKDNPDLRIYHTGYAHFFNRNDNWCDNESFGANPLSNKPKLSHQLRSDINNLVELLNS